MLAVHDVNVTRPGAVMTPGVGSKAASEVLSPAQTDLRLLGILDAGVRGTRGVTPCPPMQQNRGRDELAAPQVRRFLLGPDGGDVHRGGR